MKLLEFHDGNMPMYMPDLIQADLQRIAEDYRNQWQYLNAVGSTDGKHARLTCPANSGSHSLIIKFI